MIDALSSPLFPLEEISPDTFVKLPKTPHAESRSVKLYIIFAEPHIFLEGFTKEEVLSRPPAIIRGCLFLRILHNVKIKEINLKLKGISRTEWPEGIPPKKTEYFEQNGIISHTWPFFNSQHTYPVGPNVRNNADLFIPKTDSDVSNFSLDSNITPVNSHTDLKPMLSPANFLKSFKSASSHHDLAAINSNTPGIDENKIFIPGDYIYSFELPIQSSLPETVNVTFGTISYSLEAHVERSGTFKSNLTARRPLTIIRAPSENSSEENEPIIIDRDWENRLQYDIIIHSKQVVLNSYLPISFRMIPLEKLRIQRLRVYVTEHLDYYCHNKKVHRTEPAKKILLLEHKAQKPQENLLALGDDEIGGVEMDFQVFVPEEYSDKNRLHPDTTSENIQSHHWIKICIRISVSDPTPENPDKRKQYELSIDSPIHLLNPNCVHANTLLPSYEEQIKMDSILLNDTLSNGTLTSKNTSRATPKDSPLVTPKNQPIDSMMFPKQGTILDSNLFKPKETIPIELLSPQAKPFSTVASPELNALNPELRDTPLFNLSPVISPINLTTGERSRSASRLPIMRNSTMSHLPRVASKLSLLPRMSSATSLNEPPPPPFIEDPPKYEDIVKETKLRGRKPTTSSTISSDSTGSTKSDTSTNSNNSSKLQINVPRPKLTQRASSTNSIPSTTGSNSTSSSSQQKSTRISLKLGGNSSRRVPTLSNQNGSNTDQPSISAFLDSTLAHAVNNQHRTSSYSNMISLRSESRGRSLAKSKIKSKEQDSIDLAHNTNLKFKITPIKSNTNSPYISPVGSRSTSPIRSKSPTPIIASDRNMNRLINSSFTPAFSIDEANDLAEKEPIIASPILHPVHSKTSSLSTDPDELIERPLLRTSIDSTHLTFQQPNLTLNSLASLDLNSTAIRNASISEIGAEILDLNYMGNVLDNIDDGTDITNMIS
ncbi:hypothetical protein CANINC_005007 [Pichia inconspicua]|uniref:Arrestin C-terminal-like domain-containing protein n=1 Tax=Pichia inconspicua TaxID=52247 RepID=A0A4T0WUH6_9ASCO|nr:hypothetical protein CANINC_005007 [[Candida] inconspicua]